MVTEMLHVVQIPSLSR